MAGDGHPLLRFDPTSMASWNPKAGVDTQDLAKMWLTFTKSKALLEEGSRLENITWRLWHRETTQIMIPPCQSSCPDELSDPECGAVSSSDDEEATSLSSVDAARTRSFLCARPTSMCSASSRDTSPLSDLDHPSSSSSSRRFLPLLPPSKPSAAHPHMLRRHDSTPSSFRPSIQPRRRTCTPALTRHRLADIFAHLLPLNFMGEANAHCAEMSGSDTPKRTSLPLSAITAASIVTTKASPPKRWSAPEPGLISSITASAEATPVGTPARKQLVAPPRIVSTAPTPPAASPCTSRPCSPPSSPLAANYLCCSSLSPNELAQDQPDQLRVLSNADLIESTTLGSKSPTDPLPASVVSTSPGLSGDRPLRSALVKRGSASGKSVRISPPQPKAPPMERKGSSGLRSSIAVNGPRRTSSGLITGTRASRVGGSSGSVGSLAKNKGKAVRGESKLRGLTRKGSATGAGVIRPNTFMASGTSAGKSPVATSGSQRTTPAADFFPFPGMDLSSPERQAPQPLRTIVGFSVCGSPGKSQAAECSTRVKSVPAAAAARSPPIPATPANSQASVSIVETSMALSLSVPTNFPAPPPPTPAQQGAHLPTTMTAKLVSNNFQSSIAEEVATDTTMHAKGRAKFFFDSIETDDEASLSPKSLNSTKDGNARARFVGGRSRGEAPPAPAPPPPSLVNSRPESIAPSAEPTPVVERPALLEEHNNDDSDDDEDPDDWSSEDDGEPEVEDIFQRQARLEEEEKQVKARLEEEFKKTLFIRNPFKYEIPKIKRSGLSMLFHPELNDVSDTSKPLRNQSAVELRRSNTTKNSRAEQRNKNQSCSAFPRPSLLKSKSSAALPTLSQGAPEMTRVSPTTLTYLESARVANKTGGSSASNGAAAQNRPLFKSKSAAAALARHGKQTSTGGIGGRRPSRLAAKPDDAEFSEDESDAEQTSPQPSEAQEERLAAVAARQIEGFAQPPLTGQPLSPRTIRREMLATEMTESVRRNLVWMRQISAQQMGGMHGGKPVRPTTRLQDILDDDSPYFSKSYHHSGW